MDAFTSSWSNLSSWWRHEMETFSALLALYAGNSPVTGEFPAQRPVTRSFGVFFDLRLNKQLSKQSRRWLFATPSCSLLRHCNVIYFGKRGPRSKWNTIHVWLTKINECMDACMNEWMNTANHATRNIYVHYFSCGRPNFVRHFLEYSRRRR